MKNRFSRLIKNESGATAIEYGLIAGPHLGCHHQHAGDDWVVSSRIHSSSIVDGLSSPAGTTTP